MKYGKEFSISIYVLSKDTYNLIENFVCGNSSIDYYFRNEALTDDSAVTYMFVDDDENCLISCMTIACSAIFIQGYEEIPFSTVISAMEVKYWATNVCYQHIPYSAESRSYRVIKSVRPKLFSMQSKRLYHSIHVMASKNSKEICSAIKVHT